MKYYIFGQDRHSKIAEEMCFIRIKDKRMPSIDFNQSKGNASVFTLEIANAICALLNEGYWDASMEYFKEEVEPFKTCDGRIVKMKDDDGIEREYKLTLVEK